MLNAKIQKYFNPVTSVLSSHKFIPGNMAANGVEVACNLCKKTQAEVPQPLKRCAKCRKALYCSQDCQQTDWPSHKRLCISKAEEEATSAGNYLLRAQLRPGEIESPAIWRTLSCPAVATFGRLHKALQIAFGWATTHEYDFTIKDPSYAPEDNEDDVAAMIQRFTATFHRGQQSQTAPRQNLLRILAKSQDRMGAFGAVDNMYSGMRSHPRTPEQSSNQTKLYEVLENSKYRGNDLEYEYDFGDCWTHKISVIGRTEHSNIFVCTDGEGHPCAEDAGGAKGWNNLVEAYRTVSPTDDQREKKEWFETICSNRDQGGLPGDRVKQWDKRLVNRLLAQI